jgi:hypothetical protein
MNLYRKWIDHLNQNHMTYVEHLLFALFYGLCCLIAGILLIVHAICPCFFPTAGSDLVTKLSKRFKKQR